LRLTKVKGTHTDFIKSYYQDIFIHVLIWFVAVKQHHIDLFG